MAHYGMWPTPCCFLSLVAAAEVRLLQGWGRLLYLTMLMALISWPRILDHHIYDVLVTALDGLEWFEILVRYWSSDLILFAVVVHLWQLKLVNASSMLPLMPQAMFHRDDFVPLIERDEW